MLEGVLHQYGIEKKSLTLVEALGNGLINNTWKVTASNNEYILQRINNAVYKKPVDIASNISLIGAYFKKNYPDYRFVFPLTAIKGDELIYEKNNGYFRMFPFVPGSHSKDIVETAEQAFEAANQFGKFTRLLQGIDVKKLKITIPFFHDLTLRYQHFLRSLDSGNKKRIEESGELISMIEANAGIAIEYERIKTDPAFKLRVTHHDTKISNVLFDAEGKGLCVIDLDTAMPGYFISDVGDMMRTYLSPVSEEEKDFSKIEVRDGFYKAIVQGYCKEMKDELTEAERKSFFYAGTFMIYMQALRFFTDYLDNDIYYGAKFPEQNLARAKNQLILLQRLIEKKEHLAGIIDI